MEHLKMLVTVSLFLVAVLGLATNAFTQRELAGDAPGGNPPLPPDGMQAGPPPPMPGMVVLHAGNTGLFLLEGNQLTKFDAGTLKIVKTLSLGDAPAAPPAANNAVNAQGAGPNAGGPPPMSNGPSGSTFLLAANGAGETILAIVGNNFYLVDAQAFTIVKTTALPKPQIGPRPGGAGGDQPVGLPPAANANGNARQGQGGMPGMGPGGGMPGMGPGGMPGQRGAGIQLELSGNTLYVVRGNQLLALSTRTGELLAQGTTPLKAMPGAAK